MIGKPRVVLTNTNLSESPIEIQVLLDKFANIIVDEFPNALPPIRSINHHIDLIPGEIFPNKVAYRMTPKENEEIKS